MQNYSIFCNYTNKIHAFYIINLNMPIKKAYCGKHTGHRIGNYRM